MKKANVFSVVILMLAAGLTYGYSCGQVGCDQEVVVGSHIAISQSIGVTQTLGCVGTQQTSVNVSQSISVQTCGTQIGSFIHIEANICQPHHRRILRMPTLSCPVMNPCYPVISPCLIKPPCTLHPPCNPPVPICRPCGPCP